MTGHVGNEIRIVVIKSTRNTTPHAALAVVAAEPVAAASRIVEKVVAEGRRVEPDRVGEGEG